MAIELGEVVLDEKRLFRQLRNDLRDDWFPDPLGFSDMLSDGFVTGKVLANFEQNHGRYVPDKRILLNVPKSNFTLRYALETSLCDRALYHGLTAFLVPFYDRLIPWNAFSHRHDYVHHNSKYLFKRGVPSWRDFVGAAKSAITADSWLLSTDLTNFYENVDLDRLRDALLGLLPEVKASAAEKAAIRAHVDMLFTCLRAWAYDESKGLPQNRDASSFLANIYLYPVDCAMREYGYEKRYFRYMDDIKIVCRNEFEARKALKQLSLALRALNLTLNSKKTGIHAASDEREILDCLDEGAPEIQHIDTLWGTKSRDAILRSIPLLKQTTKKLIQSGQTDCRDFRYCINRITALALSTDFTAPSAFFADVSPAIVDSVTKFPASTDQFAQYLAAVEVRPRDLTPVARYLCDEERSVYNWQNYRLWTVLAQTAHRNRALQTRALNLVKSGDDLPSRAGASIYLGALGPASARVAIAKGFSSLTTFIGQRCGLIGIQEVPYEIVRKYVQPYVRSDLQGVYKELHAGPALYVSAVERKPVARIAEEGDTYV